MRQVWVLSDDPRVQSRLSAAFIESRYHVKYRVQVVRSISEVPDEHLSNPGVSFFVDAFVSSAPGFDGLKKLRGRGFKGPVFMLGEPAPEDAVEPFTRDSLTGFLPPLDRCDMFVAAGLVHAYHHFEGEIDLKWFLDTGGKAALEQITSIKDFNQLVLKLMNFVSRFGVNIQKLKRALVALSSSHVKNTPKGPNVNKPFKLCYGIDANKLILGVSLSSDDVKGTKFLEDFGLALSQVKGTGKGSSPRTDILNVAKITSNLVFVGGSAKATPSAETFLLTSISFPKTGVAQIEPYFFSYVEARPSAELPDEVTSAQVDAEPEPAPVAPPKKKVLFEPSITGDKPVEVEAQMMDSQLSSYVEELDHAASKAGSANMDSIDQIPSEGDAGSTSEISDVTDPEFAEKFRVMKVDLETHKRLSQALAADVKRLMKERREPLTSADMKESLAELSARLKHLQDQNKKLSEISLQKDSQIELLTAQVERLKVKAA